MNRIRNNPILIAILMAIFGLILFIKPGLTLTVIIRILGIILLVGGILAFIGYYTRGHGDYVAMGPGSYMTLFGGILSVIAGAVILIRPITILTIFPIIMAILILLTGLLNLARALDFKNKAFPSWKLTLGFAIVTIILGLVIFFNPFKTLEWHVRIIGLSLLFDALTSLWIITRKPTGMPGGPGSFGGHRPGSTSGFYHRRRPQQGGGNRPPQGPPPQHMRRDMPGAGEEQPKK